MCPCRKIINNSGSVIRPNVNVLFPLYQSNLHLECLVINEEMKQVSTHYNISAVNSHSLTSLFVCTF